MKLYVSIINGRNLERRLKRESGFITFGEFEENAITSLKNKNPDLGWINLEDLAGWYKEDFDEQLVGHVATGNKAALEEFIHNHPEGLEKGKEYLRNLRFDSDGMATIAYHDFSGWNLLNAAAYQGQADMVRFLVDEVGMDVNTPSYGVVPTYCCFPSMHNVSDYENFRRENLETARVFIEKGGDLSIMCSASAPGRQPSGLAVIHTASYIKDDILRQEAFELVTNNMKDNELGCSIADNSGKNALHHLFIMLKRTKKSFSEIAPQARLLIESGVNPHQKTISGEGPVDCLTGHNKILFNELLRELGYGKVAERCV